MRAHPPAHWGDLIATLMGAPILFWFWIRYPDTWVALGFVMIFAYMLGRGAGTHR